MARILQLTTLIDLFVFTKAPYICEFPKVKDHKFNNFRRAIRVKYSDRMFDEHGIARTHEGSGADVQYTCEVRLTNNADFRQVVADLRKGMISIATTSYFSWVNLNVETSEQGDGIWLGSIEVKARRVGKLRET